MTSLPPIPCPLTKGDHREVSPFRAREPLFLERSAAQSKDLSHSPAGGAAKPLLSPRLPPINVILSAAQRSRMDLSRSRANQPRPCSRSAERPLAPATKPRDPRASPDLLHDLTHNEPGSDKRR
jgi:hypothetical protein